MSLTNNFWDVESIGVIIVLSGVLMIIANRIHEMVPSLKCWFEGNCIGYVTNRPEFEPRIGLPAESP